MEEIVEIVNSTALLKDPTNLTVVLHSEDHTVGNALKHILCNMENVEFCGYNIPHPLEDKILIRLQTTNGVDAVEMFVDGLQRLERVFETIRQKLIASLNDFHEA